MSFDLPTQPNENARHFSNAPTRPAKQDGGISRTESEKTPYQEVVIPLFMNENTMKGLARASSPESTMPMVNAREVFQALLDHFDVQLGLKYLNKMNLQVDFLENVQSPVIRARYGINGEPKRLNHDVILQNAQELILAKLGQFGQPTDARSYSTYPDIRFMFPDSYRKFFTTEKILPPSDPSGLFKNTLQSLIQYSNLASKDQLPRKIEQTKIKVTLVPNPNKEN